jgi:hypothetical protein
VFTSLSRYSTLGRGFDLRAQAFAGFAAPRALTLNDKNGCPECEVWTSRQTAGVNATLNYEWRKGEALRPYVFGGAGVVFMHHQQKFEAPCATAGSCVDIGAPAWPYPTR